MRDRTIRIIATSLAVLAGLSVQYRPLSAQPIDQVRLANADASADWLTYGRTWGEQRFSPLTQIATGSVTRLGLAWWAEFDTDHGQEATPLEADGVIYTSTAWSKVFAFDARTGRKLWSFDPKVPGVTQLATCCDVNSRGVALWMGRVYVATLDGRLIALDAKTGRPAWSVQTTDRSRPYTITGAPRVVKGLVLIGNGGAELGVRGYVSAYRADTGKLAWRFYMTPNPQGKADHAASDTVMAAKANATWFDGAWKQTGGGGTPWDSIVYDTKTDLLFVGTGNGSPWNHTIRSQGKGDNLFLSSILALKPETGEYVWHYQTTPADNWDYTATQQIMVADLRIAGRPRHVVMQAPKNGFFYVLDAATGELLSADKYAPWADWATGVDMKTGRPIERSGVRYGADAKSSTQNPGPLGAHNWKPMAFDPKTGLVFIPAQDATFTYAGAPNARDFRYSVGVWNLGTGVQGVAGNGQAAPGAIARAAALAAEQTKAPKLATKERAVLVAWDPVARKARWSIARDNLWASSGTLATAGGLVFQSIGHDLKALTAAGGKEVWSYDMGAPSIAAPMTYALDGIQYVAVMLGNGGGTSTGDPRRSGRLMVFKLNGKAKAAPFPPISEPVLPDLRTAEASMGDAVAGGVLFRRYCTVCHSPTRVNPDLHRSQVPLSRDMFKSVVHDGVLRDGGMASFAKYLDVKDVESIRAFLIQIYPKSSPTRN
jgi:PQQ-dependent dehydrogenase (methanol/ethanol family)